MRSLLAAALLLAPSLALAQQIIPPRDLYCASLGSGNKLLKLRFALLEGEIIRKYKDFDIATLKAGENTVTFAKNAVAAKVNGMQMDPCDIETADMVVKGGYGQIWKFRSYDLKIGETPTLKFELLPLPDGKPGGYIVIRGKDPL